MLAVQIHVCTVLLCFVLTISLGQLITVAGLDKSSMPFSAKPSDDYINGQSRLDTTQQMRAILENSRLDESVLSVDLQPSYNGRRVGSTMKQSADPTQQYGYDQSSVHRNGLPGSKFDELYQQALRNAESILSDSGNPPNGHISLQNLHSPVRPVDCELSDNDSRLDMSAVPPGGSQPVSKYLDSVPRIPNGRLSANDANVQETVGRPTDTVPLQHSHHSEMLKDPLTSGRSQDVNRSADSGRVDETEISEDYTTEEDDGEEVRTASQ